MSVSGIRPDAIKYEVRHLSGVPINQAQAKRPGAFSRFLSGIGRLAGAVLAPLSLICPPAILGVAAARSMSVIGDMGQVGAARKQMETSANGAGQDLGQAYIPGLTQTSLDLTSDVVPVLDPAVRAQQLQVAKVLVAKNDMMMASAQKV